MTGRVITVFVGTDYHPFTRLVEWADVWQVNHPQDAVTIQYGYSAPPRHARGVDFLSWEELREAVRRSDVVITHGGPGTMMDVRSEGHRPLVLGRDPGLGEHVDNHQQLFVEWAAGKGLCRNLRHPDDIGPCIDALGDRGTRDETDSSYSTERTARRVAELVEERRSTSRRDPRAGWRSVRRRPRRRGRGLDEGPAKPDA